MSITNYDHPVLFGQSGPLSGMRWTIDKPLTIGRDSECDIVVPDRQVSRYHARISIAGKEIFLEDLSSKNGTYLNGELISDLAAIKDGDVLQIALVQTLVYLSSDATMPMEPVIVGGEKTNQKETLVLDERSRRVWILDQEVLPPLSVPQFRLLKLLYDNKGKVVSRQDLISTVWEDEEAMGVSDQALDALVRRLRDRLCTLNPGHEYIVTVRGYGLRLDDTVS